MSVISTYHPPLVEPRAGVTIAPLTYSDLDAIARIQFTCFAGFPENLFDPDPSVPLDVSTRRTGQRYKHYMDSGHKVLIKAYLEDTGEVVGVAVWQKPGVPFAEPECAEEDMPEALREAYSGVNMKYWKMFHAAEREGREGVLGDEPYWYLYMLCVLPEHQGRGIGSKLLNWGIEAADNAEPPLAVYMEASPIGQKLYERRGFEVVTVVETMEGRLKAPGMKRRAGYAAAGNP